MKVTTNENGVIQLEEVFSGIALKTRDGEMMGIYAESSPQSNVNVFRPFLTIGLKVYRTLNATKR